MVARPPLKVRVEPMRLEDVPAVHKIEAASFPTPWPDYAFRQELQTNRLAHYLVVRAGRETVAYGGLWLMVDEAHITTFAVLPEWRRRGVGGRLMVGLDGRRAHPQRTRRDARGASLQPAGARPVRALRLQARRRAAALLLGQRRGRADHDHGRAVGAAHAPAHRRDARALRGHE